MSLKFMSSFLGLANVSPSVLSSKVPDGRVENFDDLTVAPDAGPPNDKGIDGTVEDFDDLTVAPERDPANGPDITVEQVPVVDDPPPWASAVGNVIVGSDSPEKITGTDPNWLGFGGHDAIDGNGGDDIIDGRGGDDIISGGDGNDRIYGGYGNDRLDGGEGNDAMFGGWGNDDIWGGAGADTLDGWAGDDVLNGGSGNDILRGGYGNDLLEGGIGQDWLEGGTGNDQLIGGQGADALVGGSGRDEFVYHSTQESLNLAGLFDTIKDFNKDEDRIDLSAIDANELVFGDQAFELVQGGPDKQLLAGQLGFYYDAEAGKTIIEANIDGDAANEFRLELDGDVALTESNFYF